MRFSSSLEGSIKAIDMLAFLSSAIASYIATCFCLC